MDENIQDLYDLDQANVTHIGTLHCSGVGVRKIKVGSELNVLNVYHEGDVNTTRYSDAESNETRHSIIN